MAEHGDAGKAGKSGEGPTPVPMPAEPELTAEQVEKKLLDQKFENQQLQHAAVMQQHALSIALLTEQVKGLRESASSAKGEAATTKTTGDAELEAKNLLPYVPYAPVNPFPVRPSTLEDLMPKVYDLYGDKTHALLCKKSNSSMRSHNTKKGVYAILCNRYTMLTLRASLDAEGGGTDAVRAKLAFMEEVNAGTEGVVGDSVMKKWLEEFDSSKSRSLMTATAKQAALAAKATLGQEAYPPGGVDPLVALQQQLVALQQQLAVQQAQIDAAAAAALVRAPVVSAISPALRALIDEFSVSSVSVGSSLAVGPWPLETAERIVAVLSVHARRLSAMLVAAGADLFGADPLQEIRPASFPLLVHFCPELSVEDPAVLTGVRKTAELMRALAFYLQKSLIPWQEFVCLIEPAFVPADLHALIPPAEPGVAPGVSLPIPLLAPPALLPAPISPAVPLTSPAAFRQKDEDVVAAVRGENVFPDALALSDKCEGLGQCLEFLGIELSTADEVCTARISEDWMLVVQAKVDEIRRLGSLGGAQNGTSGTFLVPCWEGNPGYELVKSLPEVFRVKRRWDARSTLFTAPSPEGGGRTFWRKTRFAVMVVHCPPGPVVWTDSELTASDEVLAKWVVFMVIDQLVKPSTAKQYTSGVRALHLQLKFEWTPVRERWHVWAALQGCRKRWDTPSKQVMPVGFDELLQMQLMVDPNNFNDLTVFDAMVTAFFFFFRKDNVSIDKADAWNPRGHLCRCDVSFCDSGLVVVIRVRHSKTIQAGERYHTVSAHAVPGSPLCPLAALRRVLASPAGAAAATTAFQARQ
ncbi:hypothetical protein CYMTET_50382 [Cymbomonas tetramitiformis]|uniref:Uncharacterized protein n=1 Tax=Cymbomonas tetramitiformis TaxID=36881 RepID=A0AAE0BPE8_9CHLO|nr:hypothetical protein CYMTET_50382 [Cymbomonas tetramitiformis]